MAEERFSLESTDDTTAEQSAKNSLKIDGTKSRFAKQARVREDFERRADAKYDQIVDRKQRAMELAKQFWNMIQDKTLVAQKGPLQQSVEKEVLNNLVQYVIEVNNDPDEQNDGMGSTALEALLCKALLHQRDMINDLQYKLNQLEKKISKLSSEPKA